MAKLFIVGNGFDLFFDLPTSTTDFVNQLRQIPFECFESEKKLIYIMGLIGQLLRRDWPV